MSKTKREILLSLGWKEVASGLYVAKERKPSSSSAELSQKEDKDHEWREEFERVSSIYTNPHSVKPSQLILGNSDEEDLKLKEFIKDEENLELKEFIKNESNKNK